MFFGALRRTYAPPLLSNSILHHWMGGDFESEGGVVVGCWGISRPIWAKNVSGPSAQPVTTHNGVYTCVCVYGLTRPRCMYAYAHVCVCVVSSLCPVYFSSPATLHLPSTTLAIPSQPTHTGRESVDQWSRVPTGTVVEQIVPIAAVMNATSVHR